ncbi:uncharacterized protein LOC131634224 [Vicia villosa]|uniref:uncharacterized protein LOC131634222 n=1 Tax=Vicia villosa TaxID=3911 RepID=UPI00273C4199|nr:uncharacterized protein LOC131634222 [Vicia villosa]XP_058760860.1 uncharacterized protein LOC131634224 [Vicia villosa]
MILPTVNYAKIDILRKVFILLHKFWQQHQKPKLTAPFSTSTTHFHRLTTVNSSLPSPSGNPNPEKKKLGGNTVNHILTFRRTIDSHLPSNSVLLPLIALNPTMHSSPYVFAGIFEEMHSGNGSMAAQMKVFLAAEGVFFGFLTGYGSVAVQMKAFFDSTGILWQGQKLPRKPVGFFVSTGTQGSGQETTA